MPGRIMQGKVVSDKNDKTVVVLVVRRFKHAVYKKFVINRKKYSAHDPNNQFKIGDQVSIVEHRPLSKLKRWHVLYN